MEKKKKVVKEVNIKDPKIMAANDRFIKIMNLLIADGQIKNQSEFAQSLGIDSARITHIATYRLQITIDMMYRLHETYGVSMDYILFKKGVPFLDDVKKNTLNDISNMVQELAKSLKNHQKGK